MISNNNLIGLVACGGRSSRMGFDKCMIDYHGKPQMYFLYDLLRENCNKVFLSVNSSQEKNIDSGYNFICDKDEFIGHGPVSGLLSAFHRFPGSSFLFLGCDYPYLTEESINKLIDERDRNVYATCYRNSSNIVEPLICIYESSCRGILLERFNNNKFSLREFLETHTRKEINSDEVNILKSVDTISEYNTKIGD